MLHQKRPQVSSSSLTHAHTCKHLHTLQLTPPPLTQLIQQRFPKIVQQQQNSNTIWFFKDMFILMGS